MPVTLVKRYDPEWPKHFEQVKAYLGAPIVLACLRIEHVGSTSIPGMTAKPIIDLQIVIEAGRFDAVRALLDERGYFHQGDLGITGREAFDLRDPGVKAALPRHHPYVSHQDNFELKRHLAFRDFLRNHPEHAERLSAVKWSLAEMYDNDREAYMAGKSALVQEITLLALKDADRPH